MRTVSRLVVIILFAAGADAATYTVDNGNSSASDSNPGTASQPWRTIQKAADTARAGDTVVVAAGTYAERPTCAASGTASAKIVFRAAASRTAITSGFRITGSYVRIEGFRVGRTTLGYDSAISSSGAQVEIAGCLVEYAQHFGIASDGPGCTITGNRVYGCGSGILTSGDDALVQGNEVERLIFTGYDDADYSRGWGTNVTFRGNYFHGTRWTDMGDGSPHVDGFQTFFGGLHNLLFEDNWVESFHQGLMIEGVTTTEHDTSTTDLMIRDNVFIGNTEDFEAAWGVAVKDGTNVLNVSVLNNVMKDIHWYGAGIGATCTGQIRNNIMVGIANGGTPYFGDGGNNILFHTSATAGDKPNASDIVADPEFVDALHPRGADGVAFTADDGIRLLTGSPAIDAGSALAGLVDHDAYGAARPVNGRWDIGVHEFDASGGTTTGGSGTTTSGTTTSGTTTGGTTTSGTTTGGTTTSGTTTSGTTTSGTTTSGTTTGGTSTSGTATGGSGTATAGGSGTGGSHHGCGHGGGLAIAAAAAAAFTRRLRRR